MGKGRVVAHNDTHCARNDKVVHLVWSENTGKIGLILFILVLRSELLGVKGDSFFCQLLELYISLTYLMAKSGEKRAKILFCFTFQLF